MQLNVVNAKYEPRVKSSVEHARGGPRGSISRMCQKRRQTDISRPPAPLVECL